MDKSEDTTWLYRARLAMANFVEEIDIIDDDVYQSLHSLLMTVWNIQQETTRDYIIQGVIESRNQ